MSLSPEELRERAEELVDLASANNGMIYIECASTFVRAIGYDMRTHICAIALCYKGHVTTYPYFNMDFDFFVEFDRSESKGVFYNDRIKHGNYPKHQTDP